MSSYLWVALGSALGGLARYALTKWTLPWTDSYIWESRYSVVRQPDQQHAQLNSW